MSIMRGLSVAVLSLLLVSCEKFDTSAQYTYQTPEDLNDGFESEISIPEDKSYAGAFLKFDIYAAISSTLVAQASMNVGWKSNYSLTDNYRVGGLEDRNSKSISMIGIDTHQLHFKSYNQLGVALRWQVLILL